MTTPPMANGFGAADMITTEPVSVCPICGGTGEIVLTNCRDYLCGLPGQWSFRECNLCCSLWLDPRPARHEISRLYPASYGCTRTTTAEPLADPRSFSGALKLRLLADRFGYSAVAPPRSPLNNLASRLPGLSQRAGYAVRFLHRLDKGRLLDVGCGNGAFLERMRELGWEVHGVEPDTEAAAVARQRGLRVQITDVMNAEFPRENFDAITFTHVMEHFVSPVEAVRTVSPSLKPGGHLVSISPNPQSILRRVFAEHWYELDPPRHLSLPGREGYRRLLEPLGFEVTTWTSTRLIYWALKESLSIREHGAVGRRGEDWRLAGLDAFLTLVASLGDGKGEEVICHARKL